MTRHDLLSWRQVPGTSPGTKPTTSARKAPNAVVSGTSTPRYPSCRSPSIAIPDGAELAAGDRGDVDAPIVASGRDQHGPSTKVGDPHAGTPVGSGASQGIEADTQWVTGSAWS